MSATSYRRIKWALSATSAIAATLLVTTLEVLK